MKQSKKNQMKKTMAGGLALLLAFIMILGIVAPFLSLL